jgi:hypothetical protein
VKTFWIIVAALCGTTALIMAVQQNYENAFLAAAIGAVAWFLSYRFQLQEKLRSTDDTDEEDTDL